MRRREDTAIVGWREWVALPELGVEWIKAKIDTGARTSSLHAADLETSRLGGREIVRFVIHPHQRSIREAVRATAEVIDHRRVRSSSGHSSLRPVIRTEIGIVGLRAVIEITLAERDSMGFRMLLGREALRGRFIVDAGRSFYGGRPPGMVRKRRRAAASRAGGGTVELDSHGSEGGRR